MKISAGSRWEEKEATSYEEDETSDNGEAGHGGLESNDK